jgi:hypothetical protein
MAEALPPLLRALCEGEGLLACALVDIDTGMVVHSAGDADPIAEAASDYWRLFRRQRPLLSTLGEARAQVLIHDKARLTLTACGKGLLLVCLSGEPDRVDWPAWKRRAGALHAAAARL